MPKRRNPNKRRVKPYLLPECNIEYARGAYQADGSYICEVSHKRKKARPRVGIYMEDREALEPLIPCFGVHVRLHGTYRGKTMWAVERVGRAAAEIANTLATTPRRKQQIKKANERCKKMWQKGYTDKVPQ